MKTIVVDDEHWLLKRFEIECSGIADVQLVGAFKNPLSALEFAKKNNVELAFLDVEMPDMNGLELAAKLRELRPGIIVIFVSAYEKYMAEAFRSQIADYYIMKPYDNSDIVSAVDRARLLSGRMRKSLIARTFGSFELLLDGAPVCFKEPKAKELMAFFINARGERVSFQAAWDALYPDQPFNKTTTIHFRRLLRSLIESLRAVKLEDIIEQGGSEAFIHTSVLDCDLYLFSDGDSKAMRAFSGEYMTGYAWGEQTRQSLLHQSELMNRYSDVLMRNTLCAYIRCRDDAALTMTYMNDAFLAITGYTRAEIAEFFQNSLRAMIFREDFNRISCHSRELFSAGGLSETEFRLVSKGDNTIWIMCKSEPATGLGVADENELECMLIDISGLKAEQQALEQAAQRDALTGLYNRGAATERIIRYLSERADGTLCALILMDVDNFKAINDTYGHPFADTVLTDIAAILSRAFRQSDIIGRLGGDELIILLKDVGTAEFARAKLTEAIDTLSARLRAKTKKGELSCSFGGAFCPDDANDYQSLYQLADMALYSAKEQKNCVAWLPDVRMRVLDRQISREVTPIDEYSTRQLPLLAEDFEKRLSDGWPLEKAINAALAEAGAAYDASRVYIFELSLDGKYAVNTFEWCNEGIEPEIDNLRELPAEQLTSIYSELFNGDGLFYCYDVRRLNEPLYSIIEPQGIKSMLQHILEADGKLFGMIGFDECRERRYWSGRQIKLLAEFAGALARALSKRNSTGCGDTIAPPPSPTNTERSEQL